MSLKSWWIAMRRPLALGLMGAIVVSGLLWGYIATRPSEYQARFTLLAAPAPNSKSGQSDLASVASLTMPSLTDLARSPTVLSPVVAQVRGAPNIDELAGQITVELVPASGVARITLRDDDRARALLLAQLLSQQIRQLHLLEPAGTLRAFGPSPSSVRRVSPDLQLGKGFAAAAGVLAGLLVATMAMLVAPRLMGRRQVARLLRDRSVPILSFTSQSADIASWWVDSHPQVTPVAASACDAARRVRSALDRSAPDQGQDRREDGGSAEPLLLVAALGRTTPDELLNGCALADARHSKILGVMLVG